MQKNKDVLRRLAEMKMVIRIGSKGQYVAAVQRQLQSLGYSMGAIDGIYGGQTEKAVQTFQREHGIEVDGIIGPQTQEALFGGKVVGKTINLKPQPTRQYINQVLFGGQEVYDELDGVVSAVSAGEGSRFDALNLNVDGAGLSFGILQWAQNPGSLYRLLSAMEKADRKKFVEILGEGSEQVATELLSKTRGGGKRLPLWNQVWAARFKKAGQDPELQRVQRQVARQDMLDRLRDGYHRYPENFKKDGKIAQKALVMMADVGNQAGPGGLRQALVYAGQAGLSDEEKFIGRLGTYVENIIARKYGNPNYGNTQGRHQQIMHNFSMAKVDWAKMDEITKT